MIQMFTDRQQLLLHMLVECAATLPHIYLYTAAAADSIRLLYLSLHCADRLTVHDAIWRLLSRHGVAFHLSVLSRTNLSP